MKTVTERYQEAILACYQSVEAQKLQRFQIMRAIKIKKFSDGVLTNVLAGMTREKILVVKREGPRYFYCLNNVASNEHIK